MDYFKEFERFDRHIEKLRRVDSKEKVDYVSICSPNYLHDAHIRFALRVNATPICENPLVLNPWNLDALQELEEEYEKNINTILQVRCHPSILELKEEVENDDSDKIYDIDLTYITSRGPWYDYSWKGEHSKSGGVAMNIGIHFFDMLMWIFGEVEHQEIHISDDRKAGGFIKLENARVRWFLSIDKEDLPKQVEEGKTTYRSIKVEDEEIEFSGGFTDLHTQVYEKTLEGNGFEIKNVRPVINLLYDIRHMEPSGINKVNSHPLYKNS